MATKNTTNKLVPFNTTYPGELLKDEIKERGISQKELASLLAMPAPVLNDIIKGKRSITADFAVLLESVLETPASFWMNLQTQYDIDLSNIDEKIVRKKQEIAIWEIISQYVPVRVYKKLGVLNDNISESIIKIWEIFRVSTVDELIAAFSKQPDVALFKKSDKLETFPVNLFGWKNLAIWKSNKISLSTPFNPANESAIVKELNAVLYENTNTIEKVKTILNKYGIKFLIVEKFDKMPVDGLSFWHGANPTIVLTLRMKNIDNFAFSVMHELAHITKHLIKNQNQEFVNIDGCRSDIEDEANNYAQNALIPNDVWKAFMKSTSAISPYAIQHKIKTLSITYKINESIALGLYKHEMNCFSIKTNFERNIC